VDVLLAQSQQGGGIAAFLPFILIMFIIYFLMIRPQTKRQKEKDEMRKNIKKGDKIITMGGIYGTVQGIKEKNRKIVLKVDNNTNITINTTAVVGLAEKTKDEELEQR
tara:strand:+ start:3606 stop:3929 length:324 start_codon:yes stop_codon:yes gene_type:complete